MNEDVFSCILPYIPNDLHSCTAACKTWRNSITSNLLLKVWSTNPSHPKSFQSLLTKLISLCGKILLKSFSALLVYGMLTDQEMITILEHFHFHSSKIQVLINALSKRTQRCGAKNVLIPKYQGMIVLLDRYFFLSTFAHWNPHLRQSQVLQFPSQRSDNVDIATLLVGRAVRTDATGVVEYVQSAVSDRHFMLYSEGRLVSQSTWLFGEDNNPWIFADSPLRCSFCRKLKSPQTNLKSCPCKRVQYCTQESPVPVGTTSGRLKKSCQHAHWRAEHKTEHAHAAKMAAKMKKHFVKGTTFLQAPNYQSPQVAVHMLLKNHLRVGAVHQFFASFTGHVCGEDLQTPEVFNIHAGVFQFGTNKAAYALTEAQPVQRHSSMPPHFGGMLSDIRNISNWKELSMPAVQNSIDLLKSNCLVELHGMLEVAEFHVTSMAGYTQEHGIVQTLPIVASHDRLNIAHTCITAVKDVVQDGIPAILQELMSITATYETVHAFMDVPFGSRRRSTNDSVADDMNLLPLLARLYNLNSFVHWNGGEHIRGIEYAMVASSIWERIYYAHYYHNGKKRGATLSPRAVTALLGCADSFSKLGLNLLDCNPARFFKHAQTHKSVLLPTAALNMAMRYYDELLESGSLLQRQEFERKVNQLRGRTLNDLARCQTSNKLTALTTHMEALRLRQTYFGTVTLPAAQSALNVGSTLVDLKMPVKALPYLAAALCARAKLLSDPENPFVKNAMCALWNCIHAIVTDHQAWQDMEGKCAVSEQDVATLEEQAWVSLVSSLELLEEAGVLSFLQKIDTVLVHVKDFVEKYAGVDENQLQSTVEH